METIGLASAVSGEIVVSSAERLRLAGAAYLARFKGQSRVHTESDLRGYFVWCRSRRLDPLAASRVHIELFLRWMQEVRGYQPSTVSRRLSVVRGFYRTCVIDGALELLHEGQFSAGSTPSASWAKPIRAYTSKPGRPY